MFYSKECTQINASLTDKVSGFTEDTYSAVTGLAYDSTNKKLGLKVGADSVIPFSGTGNIKSKSVSFSGTLGANGWIYRTYTASSLGFNEILGMTSWSWSTGGDPYHVFQSNGSISIASDRKSCTISMFIPYASAPVTGAYFTIIGI